ncbi:hypothetical protein Tco_0409337 [Tanacetum coccineum]
MVIESEVLNDFPRFVSILIAEFAAGGAVNLTLKMKGGNDRKKLDLKQRSMPHDEEKFLELCLQTVHALVRVSDVCWHIKIILPELCGLFSGKISKETRCKCLPCGDGSCLKTFKPNEHPVCTKRLDVGSKRYHIVPYRELDGALVSLVSRFGVVSMSADRILVSHGS